VDQAKEDRFHGLEEQTLIGGDTLSGLADWCGKLQIHPGAQVLDLGCGSGAHSLMWQGMSQHLDLGFGHYVMDHAPGAVDVASTRLWGSPNAMPNHRAVGCASTITEAFPGMQFDVIFTNTVLQHNSGWKQDKIIPEIRRALDDDGVLILWTEKTFSYWEDRQMEHLLTPDYCDDRQSAGTAMWWIQRFAEFRFELLFYYHGRYAYRKSA
jgi:SAM-dependent methyltransferase